MIPHAHPTLVRALCKSIYGIALTIFLASCGGGDSSPPTTTKDTPTLTSAPAQTYTVGQPIAPLVFTNMGGAVTNCDVSPSLPAGLSLAVANKTCQITGTPMEADPSDDYTITATNAAGSDTATVKITVTALVAIRNVQLTSLGAPVPLAGDVLTLTFETTGQISFAPQVSIGGQLADVAQGDTAGQWVATITVVEGEFESNDEGFAVIVVVPNGISPTEHLSQGTTVMTVQNTPTSLSLEDTTAFLLTPILVLETTSYSFAKDQLIAPITFINAGGDIATDGCSVNTPLPQGLNLDVSGTTCEITGIPEMVADSGDYIITATNATGADAATVMITINPQVPALANITGLQTLLTNQVISAITFVNSGGAVATGGCSIDTALPQGLGLAASGDTCQITGEPTLATDSAEYTITASNAGGSDQDMATVTVVVNDPDPTADLVLLDSSGLASTTLANNVYSVDGSFTNPTTNQDASATGAKLTWNIASGVATLNFTATVGASVWSLGFTNNPASPVTEDLSAYAQGFIVFDVMVPDYGNSQSLSFQTDGIPTCADCTMDLGKVGDDFWQTIVVNVADLIGFDPMTTTSPFAIAPDIASQVNQQALSLMVQNIRWTNNAPNIPNAPILTSLADQIYVVGDSVNLNIANSGATPRAGQCSATPALPSGLDLTVASGTCQITGNPMRMADEQTYTISANNFGGQSSVTVTITVKPLAPALANALAQTYSAGQAIDPITPITFANEGGAVATDGCSIDTALPEGLSLVVSGTTCQIMGAPRVASDSTEYTITATNVGGTDTATVTITIELLEPDLAEVSAQTYTVGQDIATLTFTNEGGAVATDGCSIDTTLPEGLSLVVAGGTCQITGRPGVVASSKEYTITATNVGGSGMVTVAITVNPQAPDLVNITGSQNLLTNQVIAAITFVNSGGAVESCSSDTTLPEGLDLAASGGTCQITGEPTRTTNSAEYTITASNAGGSDQDMATVTIVVTDPEPVADRVLLDSTGLTANLSENNVYSADGSFTSPTINQDANAVGAKLTWSIASGIATLNFTATAGASVWALGFTDAPTTKDLSAYAQGFIAFDVMVPDYGDTSGLLFQTNGNSTCTNCAMDLGKAGDSFWQTIVVNVADLRGFDPMTTTSPFGLAPEIASQVSQQALSLMVQNIRWTNNAPSIPSAPILTSPTDQIYAVGDSVSLDIANGGGTPRTGQCSADPALPSGLSLTVASGTCQITGSPLRMTDAQTYTITANNFGGQSSVPVKITINPQAPDLANITGLQTLLTNQVLSAITFTNSGGTVENCSIDTALPQGLSLSASGGTCQITGEPTRATDSAEYTITASNAGGSDQDMATVTIVVNDPPVADRVLLDSTGLTANLSENNVYSADGAFASPTISQDANAVGAKLTWGIASGVATLNFTATAGASVWALGFTDEPTTKDLSTYAQGFITFDVMVPDYNNTPSLLFQANGNSTCANCTMDLGKAGDDFWQTIVVNVADLTGFDPTTTTSPFGIAPDAASQVSQQALSLMVQNIRWTNNAPNIPSAPILTSPADQIYAVGDSVNLNIANGGGAPRTGQCSADPTLPSGLSLIVASGTCQITGSPRTMTDARTYTILVNNFGGQSSTPVKITVNPQAPVFAEVSAQTYSVEQDITTLALTNEGGAVVTDGCSSEPVLPQGLSITVLGTTCQITGAPEVASDSTDYIITATNAGGAGMVTLTITVNPLAPDLTNITGSKNLLTNQVIPVITFVNLGGAVESCGNTALPQGLSLTAAGGTCQITGEPTLATDSAEYTITATNAGGSDQDMATITLVVNDPDPVADLVLLDGTGLVNTIFAGNVYSADGAFANPTISQDANAAGAKLTWSTTLGIATLNFTATTGASVWALGFTDAPTTKDLSAYAQGFIVFDVMVPDYGNAPGLLFQANRNSTCTNCTMDLGRVGNGFWQTIVVNVASLTGFTPTTTTSPFGLSPDTTSQVAQQTLSLMVQNIRWTNNAPNIPSAPILTSPANQIYTIGDSVNLNIANGGGTPSAGQCSADPALLSGLELTVTSGICQITGNPRTMTDARTYTITANNFGGQSSTTVTITVNPLAPVLANALAQTYSAGQVTPPITPIIFTNEGGAVAEDGCRSEPALPQGLGLAVSGTTCQITGAPRVASDSTEYIITATNAGGTDTATVMITTNLLKPELANALAQIYTAGQDIPSITFTNTGGAVATDGCSIDTTLPEGLALAASGGTCQITGRPMLVAPAKDYTITARNITGSDTATVTLSVNIQALALTNVANLPTFIVGQPITPITFTNEGGAVQAGGCRARPALPLGLSLEVLGNTCQITGAPLATAISVEYDIIATNAASTDTATVTIEVELTAPDLDDIAIVQSLSVDQPISSRRFPNAGGSVASCDIEPALPQGLRVAVLDNTCAIKGTPTEVSDSKDYTITAENALGSDTASVTIVTELAPPNLVDIVDEQVLAAGQAISAITFTNLGGAATECTVFTQEGSPANLPSGLEVEVSGITCAITGTPEAATLSEQYTITATNASGTDTASVILVVTDLNLALDITTLTLTTLASDSDNSAWFNQATTTQDGVDALQSGAIGHASTSCTQTVIDTATLGPGQLNYYSRVSSEFLRDYLVTYIDEVRIDTGVSGVEEGWTLRTHEFTTGSSTIRWCYEKNSSINGGEDTAWLDNFTYAAIPVLADIIGVQSFAVGQVISDLIFTNTGGAVAAEGCSIEPSLPNGLSLEVSGNTCIITGTPLEVSDSQAYTITASNDEGSDEDDASVTIGVAATLATPALTDILGAQAFGVGQAITPILLTNEGGAVAAEGCRIEPNLPQGLSLEVSGSTCTITGKPTVITASDDYTITATNTAGQDTTTVTIEIRIAAPILADILGIQSFAIGQAISDLSFDNAGGAVEADGCNIEPRLPSGLNLDISGNTCVILGTPLMATAPSQYTVTATNASGSGMASVTIALLGLNLALDIDNLVFTSQTSRLNNPPWFSQTSITQDGVDALQSGAIGHRNTTCIQTSIDTTALGIGRLSYYSRVSSQSSSDYLVTYIDDKAIQEASGEVEWTLRTHEFTTGSSTIRWCYEKDSFNEANDDAAWLDNFMYIAPPVLTDITGMNSFGMGQTISDLTFINTGGAVAVGGCGIEPSLPNGLSLEASGNSCIITGTPLEEVAAKDYLITAMNADGPGTTSITLGVATTLAIPALTDIAGTQTFPVGQAITPILLTNEGGAVAAGGCSVNSLPQGLSLEILGNTCVITGTPTDATASEDYTITATNFAGPDTASVNIDIRLAAPSLADIPSTRSFRVGRAIRKFSFINTGSAVQAGGCKVRPALPRFLRVFRSGNTCAIAAAATRVAAERQYTITATNDAGEDTATITIVVNPRAPVLTDAPKQIYTAGQAISTLSFRNRRGAVESCSVTPALPEGLELTASEDTCEITGLPTISTSLEEYTVLATNATGTDEATVTITVNPRTPALANPSAQTYTVGQAITPISFANEGGAVATGGCDSQTTLPQGLSLATSGTTCQITGVPTLAIASREYIITATNVHRHRHGHRKDYHQSSSTRLSQHHRYANPSNQPSHPSHHLCQLRWRCCHRWLQQQHCPTSGSKPNCLRRHLSNHRRTDTRHRLR